MKIAGRRDDNLKLTINLTRSRKATKKSTHQNNRKSNPQPASNPKVRRCAVAKPAPLLDDPGFLLASAQRFAKGNNRNDIGQQGFYGKNSLDGGR
jgi:hypothetical protein